MYMHYIISAAGGNPTAIEVILKPRTRSEYERIGRELMDRYKERFRVEQTGSLLLSEQPDELPHFEMSGGEFCGNAARAVALVIANTNHQSMVRFTMSGIRTVVSAQIDSGQVTCIFKELPTRSRQVSVAGYPKATIVDMGGIVHVLVEGQFPDETYENMHQEIIVELGLGDRVAVGVVWYSHIDDSVLIHPVVWVRSAGITGTFFYESSCGSGSIATAVALQVESIAVTQPTGQDIRVSVDGESIILSSAMEVIHHE
jgi:histidine racemase